MTIGLPQLEKIVLLFNGQLEARLITYNTLLHKLTHRRLVEVIPFEDWTIEMKIYLAWSGALLDLTALVPETELDTCAKGLLSWWKNRHHGDVMADCRAFLLANSMDAIGELATVYNNANTTLPAAPEILAEKPDDQTDPERLGAGVKPSKKRSSR